jgi:hypothetical protein
VSAQPLHCLLREFRFAPTDARGERRHDRGVMIAPRRGGRAVVYRRTANPSGDQPRRSAIEEALSWQRAMWSQMASGAAEEIAFVTERSATNTLFYLLDEYLLQKVASNHANSKLFLFTRVNGMGPARLVTSPRAFHHRPSRLLRGRRAPT